MGGWIGYGSWLHDQQPVTEALGELSGEVGRHGRLLRAIDASDDRRASVRRIAVELRIVQGRVVRHDHHRTRRVPGERSRDASKERRGEAAAAAGAHHDQRGADVVGDLVQLARDVADRDALVGVHRRRQGVGRALEDLVDASPAAVAGPLALRPRVRRADVLADVGQ